MSDCVIGKQAGITKSYLSQIGKDGSLWLVISQNTKGGMGGEGRGLSLTFTVFQDYRAQVKSSITIYPEVI